MLRPHTGVHWCYSGVCCFLAVSMSGPCPGRLFGGGGPFLGGTSSRCRPTFFSPLLGGRGVHGLAPTTSALFASPGRFIDCRPGPLLGFFFRYAAIGIAFGNMFRLAFLFLRVFGFFSARHGSLSFLCEFHYQESSAAQGGLRGWHSFRRDKQRSLHFVYIR